MVDKNFQQTFKQHVTFWQAPTKNNLKQNFADEKHLISDENWDWTSLWILELKTHSVDNKHSNLIHEFGWLETSDFWWQLKLNKSLNSRINNNSNKKNKGRWKIPTWFKQNTSFRQVSTKTILNIILLITNIRFHDNWTCTSLWMMPFIVELVVFENNELFLAANPDT